MRLPRSITIAIISASLFVLTLGSACSCSVKEQGLQGTEGPQGPAGVGISGIVDNADGTFTVNLTNGSSFTTDNLTGPTMPVIQSLSVSDIPAKPGTAVTAAVAAQSAAGLALTYSWTVSAGWTIAGGADSSIVSITAPAAYAASGSAIVTVTDSKSRTATGTMSLSTERNLAPIINSIWTSGNPVLRGETIDVFCSAADPNGDTVTHQWSVPPGWMIQSGDGTNHIVVRAPNKVRTGGYADLTVSDGNGGSAGASLYVGTLDGSWTTAEHLMGVTPYDAGTPDVAADPNGNAFAVWQQSDGARTNIWANRFVPEVGWGSPALIETDDSGSARNPHVAMDPAGNAIAVWYQSDGLRNNICASRFTPAAGWGTATAIETGDGEALDPQVALDPTGNAMAVWHQLEGATYSIRANRFSPATNWGTAATIETDDSGDAFSPQVAMDPAGNAVAVWYQSDGLCNNIWANRFVPATNWGTAVLIETDNGGDALFPQVALDPNGNAIAVWQQSDGTLRNICSNRFAPATGWGTAVAIETDSSGDALHPQVAVDTSGNAIAVWQQHDGLRYNIWANRYLAATGWGSPVSLEAGWMTAEYPQVALDFDGNAVVLWQQSDGLRNNIWAARHSAAAGWGTARLVETADGSADLPQLASDAAGNAIAVWVQNDGAGLSIWASRFQ